MLSGYLGEATGTDTGRWSRQLPAMREVEPEPSNQGAQEGPPWGSSVCGREADGRPLQLAGDRRRPGRAFLPHCVWSRTPRLVLGDPVAPHSSTARLRPPAGQASEDTRVCSGARARGRGGGGGVPLRWRWLVWAPVPVCTDWHFSRAARHHVRSGPSPAVSCCRMSPPLGPGSDTGHSGHPLPCWAPGFVVTFASCNPCYSAASTEPVTKTQPKTTHLLPRLCGSKTQTPQVGPQLRGVGELHHEAGQQAAHSHPPLSLEGPECPSSQVSCKFFQK